MKFLGFNIFCLRFISVKVCEEGLGVQTSHPRYLAFLAPPAPFFLRFGPNIQSFHQMYWNLHNYMFILRWTFFVMSYDWFLICLFCWLTTIVGRILLRFNQYSPNIYSVTQLIQTPVGLSGCPYEASYF